MSLFIAVPIPAGIADHLDAYAAEIARLAPSASITRTENRHLTLAFLGKEASEEAIARATAALDSLAADDFSFDVRGLGYFPTREPNNCIVWAHVEEVHELRKLHQALVDLLREQGFALGHTEFRPHVTLARKVERIAAAQLTALEFEKPSFFASAGEVRLYGSVPRPEGGVSYETLATRALVS